MKNMTLKKLAGISANQLLEEAKAVRKRVSNYSDDQRFALLAAARASIHGHANRQKVSSRA